MMKKIRNVNIFDGNKFKKSDIIFSKKILSIQTSKEKKEPDYYLIPKFFDSHTHGGYGLDFNKIYKYDYVKVKKYIEKVKKEGVDKIFITTVSDSFFNLKRIACSIRRLIKILPKNHIFFGWHLEGPFINKQKSGAHNKKYIRPLNEGFLKWLKKHCKFPIMLTFAPEVSNNLEIAKKYKNDFWWSIGHTNISHKLIETCLKYGFNRITHLCNGMLEFNHRYEQESLVNYAFNDNFFCEVITDYKHVNCSTLNVINRTINHKKIFIVSDSLYTKGLKDGNYSLGNLKITKKGEVCYLKNTNILAGSNAKYNFLFKKMLKITHNMLGNVLLSSMNVYDFFKIQRPKILEKEGANFLLVDKEGKIIRNYEWGNKRNK